MKELKTPLSASLASSGKMPPSHISLTVSAESNPFASMTLAMAWATVASSSISMKNSAPVTSLHLTCFPMVVSAGLLFSRGT